MSQTKTTNKRFFWLKLHHDFFNRDEIRIIESQTNGKDYIIFYLKLMLKSINDNGKLLFKDTIPYTPEMLASITQTQVDTVRVAIDAFVKIGLIEVLDDGALFMQEVQKLVGSETPDAERKRTARAGQKTPAKLPRADNKRTLSGQCPENVLLENKSIELKSKENKTPYIPQEANQLEPTGDFGVLATAERFGFAFTRDELTAIINWLKFKVTKSKSIQPTQVDSLLEILHGNKVNGYDIIGMIRHSIANDYSGVMTPTTSFLLASKQDKKLAGLNAKYPAEEYITPENSNDRMKLRSYLERCYLMEKVDPRTGLPLTDEQKELFGKHISRCRSHSPVIGIGEYIYEYEVLTHTSLLEQAI